MKKITLLMLLSFSFILNADKCVGLTDVEIYTSIYVGQVIAENTTLKGPAKLKVFDRIKGDTLSVETVHNLGTATSSWFFAKDKFFLVCEIDDTIRACSHTRMLDKPDEIDINKYLGFHKRGEKDKKNTYTVQ